MTRQTKYFVIAAVVILALAAGAFVYLMPAAAPAPGVDVAGENPPAATGTPSVPPTVTTPPAPNSITMVQVATHASVASCWTVVRGSVYDLTAWIAKHPGGQAAILGICGKDGTDKFVGKHGGSAPQEDTLLTFKIGVLAQ